MKACICISHDYSSVNISANAVLVFEVLLLLLLLKLPLYIYNTFALSIHVSYLPVGRLCKRKQSWNKTNQFNS